MRFLDSPFRRYLVCRPSSKLVPLYSQLLSRLVLCLFLLLMAAASAGADDVQQLVRKANAAYQAGKYQACMEHYAAAIDEGAASAEVYYNAACCCALHGDIDPALDYIGKALKNGFRDVDLLKQDSDLESLRSNAQWPKLMQECQAANEAYLKSINRELYLAYQEDQGDRKSDSIDWSIVHQRDVARRERVKQMLDSGLVRVSDDYFHAAMVFQHGDDSADYRLAHELSVKAVELDSSNGIARWLAAASKDRYLWKIGRPQIYGTQYHIIDGLWTIDPIDTTAVTDEERLRWQVPPLSEARLKAIQMNDATEQ